MIVADHREYFTQVLCPDCPNCGANPCYHQCPNSPHYYSAEREREDALYNDSLSHDEWFRQAVAQYEMAHGEPYVS